MRKNKAVFLDRDGVINKEIGRHVHSLQEFEILPGVIAGLKALHDQGFLLIIITNQSGLALGYYSETDLEAMHQHLQAQLSKVGMSIAAIYYCNHHPSVSTCLCRKPSSLLVEKALARFKIDPKKSIMFGDKQRDVEAAQGAGVKGVLVEANVDFSLIVSLVKAFDETIFTNGIV